jgi:hypothetical protein
LFRRQQKQIQPKQKETEAKRELTRIYEKQPIELEVLGQKSLNSKLLAHELLANGFQKYSHRTQKY